MATQSNDEKSKFYHDFEDWLKEKADALTYLEDEVTQSEPDAIPDLNEVPNDDYSGSLDEI